MEMLTLVRPLTPGKTSKLILDSLSSVFPDKKQQEDNTKVHQGIVLITTGAITAQSVGTGSCTKKKLSTQSQPVSGDTTDALATSGACVSDATQVMPMQDCHLQDVPPATPLVKIVANDDSALDPLGVPGLSICHPLTHSDSNDGFTCLNSLPHVSKSALQSFAHCLMSNF